MKKKVYLYEIDSLPNLFMKIKKFCFNYSNYMIVHQYSEEYKYTYIGLNPKEYIYTQDKCLNIVNKTQFLNKKGDYLKQIIEWLNRNEIIVDDDAILPPFYGGAMGFINDTLDDYYKNKTYFCDIPELCFLVFNEMIIIDHERNKILFTYIGDLSYEEYYKNHFKLIIDKINNVIINEDEKIHSSLIFNENEILEKFNKTTTKFIEDRYFYIKSTEKVIIDTNATPLDLYYKMINNNEYSMSSFFKTSDFTLIVLSKQNDLSLIDKKFNLTYKQHELCHISHDLIFDQLVRMSQIKKLNLTNKNENLNIDGEFNNISIYDFILNLALIQNNYGMPFERIHSYIRRTESNYRLNGLIGLLGYNNNFIASQIIEPIIYDRDEHYINIESYHTNLTQSNEYIIKVIEKVNQYLDLLEE